MVNIPKTTMTAPIFQRLSAGAIGLLLAISALPLGQSQAVSKTSLSQAPLPDEVVDCELLIVGGGLSGTSTAYEGLRAGRTVCMTELTDWVGGQISSQGTSALDEAKKQRSLLFYSAGYKALRQRIEERYGELNPGGCWVSVSCFFPGDAHEVLSDMLEDAAKEGGGELKWFPSTVVKELMMSADGRMINSAIAIQHTPQPNAVPLNTKLLSETLLDSYSYEDSDTFSKTIIQFVPTRGNDGPADWYVVEATETGEVIALSGVPYRLGLDPKSSLNPSSPTETTDPYCVQGFTYTFGMERTAQPQPQPEPAYYQQYAPYFSYERSRDNNDYFDYVFTYRRISAPDPRPEARQFGVSAVTPGDISMQNWTWGNDYRPGTSADNLIFSAFG